MEIDRGRYLTLEEAAERSGYGYDHIRKLVKAGSVASLEIAPRHYLVDYDDLMRYKDEKPQRKPHKDKRKG
jgi:excisionase family DNA binding protein